MYVHKLIQTILKQKTTTNHFKNFKNYLRNYWKNFSYHSYQTGSKKSMIGNEFVFNNNVGLHYKCHDISLNLKFCWFDKMHKRHNKPKKRQLIFQYQTINSFRYFITVILNYKKIKKCRERTSKIKVARVVNSKLTFTDKFFYSLIILTELCKIRYRNWNKPLLFQSNHVICLKKWELWPAATTIEFNIFCWNFDVSY